MKKFDFIAWIPVIGFFWILFQLPSYFGKYNTPVWNGFYQGGCVGILSIIISNYL